MTRRDVPGVVYLLHFDQPIGDTASRTGYAQHYTGWASDLARLAEHLSSSDVRIVQAFRQAGIGWQVARTWPGTRARERQIKTQGGASRHCPVCKGQPPQLTAAPQANAGGRVPVPAPRQAPAPVPPLPEPPLWEFVVSHLEAAEAAALLGELEAAERAAWSAASPAAGPEYEPRFRGPTAPGPSRIPTGSPGSQPNPSATTAARSRTNTWPGSSTAYMTLQRPSAKPIGRPASDRAAPNQLHRRPDRRAGSSHPGQGLRADRPDLPPHASRTVIARIQPQMEAGQ